MVAIGLSAANGATSLLESTAGLGFGGMDPIPSAVNYKVTMISGTGASFSITIPGVVPFNDATLTVPLAEAPVDFVASLTNGVNDSLTIVHMFDMWTLVQVGWESEHLLGPVPGQNDLAGKTIEAFVFEACGDESRRHYDFTVAVTGAGIDPPTPTIPEPSRALLGGLPIVLILLQRRRRGSTRCVREA